MRAFDRVDRGCRPGLPAVPAEGLCGSHPSRSLASLCSRRPEMRNSRRVNILSDAVVALIAFPMATGHSSTSAASDRPRATPTAPGAREVIDRRTVGDRPIRTKAQVSQVVLSTRGPGEVRSPAVRARWATIG